MQCPKCQFQNPNGLKFCNDCGQKLTIVCPSCQSVNQPSSRFCGECGYDFTKISAITSQPTETTVKPTITDQERKHVTVMFSDLSGYTAMTEKLDPKK